MEYYELKIRIELLRDMVFTEVPYNIGVFINNSMLNNVVLKRLHEEKFYKYVYDTFYPLEKDGVYKMGKCYTFRLRTVNLQFLNKIAMVICNHEYFAIKAIDVDLYLRKIRKINSIVTIKPVIITINNKPWLKEKDSMEIMKSKLNDNLSKKIKQFEGDNYDVDQTDFIKDIKIINKVPMKYKYKEITLLGNKFNISVKNDDVSQKKALMAVALGLGEKGSSLGAGFCNYSCE